MSKETWISFRKAPWPTVRFFGMVFGVIFMLLTLASLVGQLRAHSFAGYFNNLMNIAVPLFGFGIVALLALTSSILFPVKIGPAGIRTYASFWRQRTIAWNDIVSARLISIYGVPHLTISTSCGNSDVTIPAEVVVRKDFRANVERFAGRSNAVTECINGL